jgi:hypothetical protein
MTVAEAARERLLDCAPVTALVSTRVWKDIAPQKPVLPFVRVERVGQAQPIHLRGPVGVDEAVVMVTSVATTKAAAEALDAAVEGDGLGSQATGLFGWTGSLGSPAFTFRVVKHEDVKDGYVDSEFRQFFVKRLFRITYSGS